MESHPQREMIRLVCDGGVLRTDETGRAPGRGVYFCRNEECVEKGRKNRAFNRSFKRNFSDDVLEAAFADLIGIIRGGN